MPAKPPAWILATTLGAIAGLHGYWALGGLWPGHDVQSLINTVIGDPRFTQMPAPWMTWGVVGALFVAAVLAFSASGVWRVA